MKIVLTVYLVYLLIPCPFSVSAQNRADWMGDSRWGVMIHYLSDGFEQKLNFKMTPQKWNETINAFDVDALAGQLALAGAHYCIITIGQNSGYYLAPNATYDQLTGISPSKCSRRDLIADLARALRQKGIRLIVYLPSGAPDKDQQAMKALHWKPGPDPNKAFQIMWEKIIREWAIRWGNSISGWWFDGCYWPNHMYRSCEAPNFTSFSSAARLGNPKAIVAFNTGVIPRLISVTPDEDYTAGEINDPATLQMGNVADGKIDGTQVHVLTYLGKTWGNGNPRFTEGEVIQYSKSVLKNGGAITWDVPIQINGSIDEPYLKMLKALDSSLKSGKN